MSGEGKRVDWAHNAKADAGTAVHVARMAEFKTRRSAERLEEGDLPGAAEWIEEAAFSALSAARIAAAVFRAAGMLKGRRGRRGAGQGGLRSLRPDGRAFALRNQGAPGRRQGGKGRDPIIFPKCS
ncbi:MAG: hypothetical protein LBE49_05495 [Deltaproteobacteria bacterium]|jgi:hypothetical protein|nr:hypothetical protein [Deltaproteobacteria bacterium]